MRQYKIDLTSQVILLFENKKKSFPNVENVGGYLNQIEDEEELGQSVCPGYCMGRYEELGEVKVLASVIVSGLTYQFEYDDLFYTIKDNTIYVDRLDTKDKVR